MGWPAPREGKVLWKTTTKKKYIIYWEESITYQSNFYISEEVLYIKGSITLNRKFYLSKRYIKQKVLFL